MVKLFVLFYILQSLDVTLKLQQFQVLIAKFLSIPYSEFHSHKGKLFNHVKSPIVLNTTLLAKTLKFVHRHRLRDLTIEETKWLPSPSLALQS